MKRRLLILGASSLQLPAIKVAKHKGFLVGVVDRDLCCGNGLCRCVLPSKYDRH